MTSFIGLIPLLFGQGEVGKEILHPMVRCRFRWNGSHNLLDQLVTPASFIDLVEGSMEARGITHDAVACSRSLTLLLTNPLRDTCKFSVEIRAPIPRSLQPLRDCLQ